MGEPETLTVTVRHVLWSADDGSFSILDTLDEGSGDDVAVIGPVGHLQPGDRAKVNGIWEEHARYGHQLRAADALPLDPTDREGQIAYLTSLRHIGEVRADALCRIHGESVLEAIAADPEGVFGELPGLGARQAAAAADSWHESRAVRDLHVQLAPHGLAHIASLLHARHGTEAMRVLHEDPYGLVEIDGVGFQTADRIALGERRPARLRAARPGRGRLRARTGRAQRPHPPPPPRAGPRRPRAARHHPRPRRARLGARA